MATVIGLILLFLLFIVWGFVTANSLRYKMITIRAEGWPEKSTRILFMSDLHTSGRGFRIKRTIKLAKEAPCDIVCITGDIIVRRVRQEERVVQALKEIANGRPTFLVWGNNDYNPEIDRAKLYEELQKANINVLVNERVKVGNLTIGGLGDPFWGKDDIEKTLAEDVDLLLSHTPSPIFEVKKRAKLMLTGHTHAGQFCSIDGTPLMPELRKKEAFAYGLSYHNGTHIYTTSGIGTTRLPLRFFCHPELVLLEVRPK
jgi:predicted MPP superfamily phosphohydrolase